MAALRRTAIVAAAVTAAVASADDCHDPMEVKYENYCLKADCTDCHNTRCYPTNGTCDHWKTTYKCTGNGTETTAEVHAGDSPGSRSTRGCVGGIVSKTVYKLGECMRTYPNSQYYKRYTGCVGNSTTTTTTAAPPTTTTAAAATTTAAVDTDGTSACSALTAAAAAVAAVACVFV